VVGQLTAESGRINTYEDAIGALLHRSSVLPEGLLKEIGEFIGKNKQLKFSTKEEFLKEGAHRLMGSLCGETET